MTRTSYISSHFKILRSILWLICLAAIVAAGSAHPLQAQWAWNGGTIYNTNPGLVGINTAWPTANFSVIGNMDVGDAIWTYGPNAGYFLLDRAGNGLIGALYSADGTTRFWNNSVGDVFAYDSAGRVGIGTLTPSTKLEVAGDITVSGNITGSGNIIASGNIAARYQDLAEWVSTAHALPAGTVVALDTQSDNGIVPSSIPYDTHIAGVVSDSPGIILGQAGPDKLKIATTGRVKVHVDTSNGPIRRGDLLVTSSKEGTAMRSEAVSIGGIEIHRPGTLIGKALEPLETGEGEILVLLSLQ